MHTLEKLLKNCQFIKSAASLEQCPKNSLLEVAFVGRSNVGKSSVINTLCHQTRLAKTSKTPGRTQLLNFFQIGEGLFLVDLPGYGYAKVERSQLVKWQQEITRYLIERKTLAGLILIMDIRHPLKETDQQLLSFAHQASLSTHVILNKSDKISKNQALQTQRQVIENCSNFDSVQSVQLFSAHKRQGAEPLYEILTQLWRL